jgi:glutamate:GABA antiporter
MGSHAAPGRGRGPGLSRPAFARVLGRADLILFSVCAILTIDTLASAASMGVSWFTWWAITMALFFVPYGLMTAELGAAWPAEGGLYVWVREAMGPRWGSLAAWFYWINMTYWTASVYMVFAGTFQSIFLGRGLPPALREGAGATWLQAGIAILLTWLTVAVGIVRLDVSKWLPSLGGVVKVAIFLGLGGLGLASLLRGRPPANPFTAAELVPRWGDSMRFLPVLVYNALGFELMSSAGEEMRDPQRDVPRVILVSGLVIAAVYTLGALGILLAVPLGELSIVTGTWDALQVLGRQWGAAGGRLVLLLGIGFLYACVANVVTWSLGVNRVAAAAASEGAMPRGLGRLHRRFQTPYVAFVVMGAIATLLLVGNAALSRRADNVFWMIFKLSGVCFLVSYLMVFPAFVILRRRRADRARPYRMPGGAAAAWTAAAFCWAFIAGATLLFFMPAPTAEDHAGAVRESWLLVGETLATLVVGLLLMPRRVRAPGTPHRGGRLVRPPSSGAPSP